MPTTAKINPSRYVVCSAILVAVLTILSYRVISLQWLHRDDEKGQVKKSSHFKIEKYPAYRGLIIDRNEEPLVVNIPKTNLLADKYHLEDESLISWGVAYKRLKYDKQWASSDKAQQKKMLSNMRFSLLDNELASNLIDEHYSFIVSLIAKPLKKDKKELLDLLQDPKKKLIRIAKDLNEMDADYIERLLKENRVFGLDFDKRLTRYYPSPTLATHLIGYTKDYKGQTGIEARYNSVMSGIDGFQKRKSNPNNLSIFSDEEEVQLPVQGLNVQLSIDATLQSIVEEELKEGLKYAQAQKGCAIMIAPESGDILAMAARPHFNLNTREGVVDGSLNYIFKTALEPGSTFKLITAASALNEGHVRIHSPLIDCEGGYYRDGSVILKDGHARNHLSLAQILAKSSNIGSYKLGRQTGKKRFFEYVKAFGIGEPTGLNWKGEVPTKGTVGKSPQEFASATYGYAISATPLHMAIAYATVANDGVMMRPKLVKAVIDSDGTVIENHPDEEMRRVIKTHVAKDLRKALVTVTEDSGTAKRARVEGYEVAGKTGTSLKWEDGKYHRDRYVCSFGGMMPAENPKFVIFIVIDDPMTNEVQRYGGTLAAPIFSRIAEKSASYMDIAPTHPTTLTNAN